MAKGPTKIGSPVRRIKYSPDKENINSKKVSITQEYMNIIKQVPLKTINEAGRASAGRRSRGDRKS